MRPEERACYRGCVMSETTGSVDATDLVLNLSYAMRVHTALQSSKLTREELHDRGRDRVETEQAKNLRRLLRSTGSLPCPDETPR